MTTLAILFQLNRKHEMTIQHITHEEWLNAVKTLPTNHDMRPSEIANAVLDLRANEEQEQPLITAEEARKLEAGKAEVLSEYGVWLTVNNDCPYRETWKGEVVKYRAIKQEPVEPTCQIKNLDTGVTETMTREAAQKLQAELGDTVEWRYQQSTYVLLTPFYFVDEGIFTCKLRGTVKLTIDDELPKMLTPNQCENERLARVDTHDVECSTSYSKGFEPLPHTPSWFPHADHASRQYRLVKKPAPKLISLDWKAVPVGVAVTVTVENQTWILNSVDGSTAYLRKAQAYAAADISEIELAPASEQPWQAYIHGETDLTNLEGFEIEVRYWDLNQRDYLAVPRTGIFAPDARFISAYRITGLAEGYELK